MDKVGLVLRLVLGGNENKVIGETLCWRMKEGVGIMEAVGLGDLIYAGWDVKEEDARFKEANSTKCWR